MKRSCDASYVLLASSRLKEVAIWTDHVVGHVDRSWDLFTLSWRVQGSRHVDRSYDIAATLGLWKVLGGGHVDRSCDLVALYCR